MQQHGRNGDTENGGPNRMASTGLVTIRVATNPSNADHREDAEAFRLQHMLEMDPQACRSHFHLDRNEIPNGLCLVQ